MSHPVFLHFWRVFRLVWRQSRRRALSGSALSFSLSRTGCGLPKSPCAARRRPELASILLSRQGDTFRLPQSRDQVCQRKGRSVLRSLGARDSWWELAFLHLPISVVFCIAACLSDLPRCTTARSVSLTLLHLWSNLLASRSQWSGGVLSCVELARCLQERPLSARPDFGPDFGFLGPTQRLFFPSRGPTSLRTFPTHWFPRLKQLLCVRESESRMYVAQLWSSACPCTLIVVPMRVLFPKKKENRSARFAKAATSSYLVDVSPTHSFARCVGLVGADLDLGGRMCVWTLRDYSSSKPTSDPARSPTCVRLSV